MVNFLGILEAKKGKRTVIVASARHKIISEFRKLSNDAYPTNLSPKEQIFLKLEETFKNRVLETVYHPRHSGASIVEGVRGRGGATYVFLTAILLYPAIDWEPDKKVIFKILDRRVDGIMTDRPAALKPLMEEWKRLRCP